MEKRRMKMAGNTVITINIAEDLPYVNVDDENHFYLDTKEHNDEYYANTFLYTIHYTILKGLSGIEWSINANKCNVYQRHIEVVKDKYMSYFKEWLNSRKVA